MNEGRDKTRRKDPTKGLGSEVEGPDERSNTASEIVRLFTTMPLYLSKFWAR